MMKIRDGNLPTGKGQFLWLMPRLVHLFGSVGALVEELVVDGFQWVSVNAQHGYLLGISSSYPEWPEHLKLLDEFCPLAEAAGIEVHGWGYNYGNTTPWRKANDMQGKETARIVEALLRWRFRSWTLNAESEFKVKGGNTAAFNLTNLVRETLAAHPEEIDVPVGLSSYRFVSAHSPYGNVPGFPFWGFLQGCDFGAPQVYWQKSRYPVEQLEKSVAEWRAVAELPQVVAGTIYPEGDWWPTGDQVLAFSERANEMPEVIAVNYWEHFYPFKYQRADLVAALAAFDWPAVEPEQPKPPRVLTPEEIRRGEAMLARMK